MRIEDLRMKIKTNQLKLTILFYPEHWRVCISAIVKLDSSIPLDHALLYTFVSPLGVDSEHDIIQTGGKHPFS